MMQEKQPLDLEKLSKRKRLRVAEEDTWKHVRRFGDEKIDRLYYLEIKGKFGVIYPYNDKELRVVVFKTYTAHKVAELLGQITKAKKGDEDIFSFEPEKLEEVAKLIHVRRRREKRELTPEQRGVLAEQLKRGRDTQRISHQDKAQSKRGELESNLFEKT